MNYITEYTLNFVIPMGSTGPVGPTGPVNLISIISMHYDNTTSAGIVPISSRLDNLILPSNSNIFIVNTNEIVINEDGYYEFSFYGLLTDNTATNPKANLALKIDTTSLITINLSPETNELYFSRTLITKCNSTQKITIEFNKQNASNASVENIYLLVKKLYFQ